MITKRKTASRVLFVALLFVHGSGNQIPAEPEGYIDCPLCSNATHQVFPSSYGTFLTDTGVVSCQEAFAMEIRLPRENCTAWQSRGEDVCHCAAEPPERHDCKLCDDGGSLPQGALAAIPGTVCAQLQVDAKRDFQDRCPIWQQTMGNYCGCNNAYDASICRLCKEGYNFDPAKIVNGLDNTTISCGRLEFSANLATGDFGCKEYQFIFESRCCEKVEEELTDISGTMGPSGIGLLLVITMFGAWNILL